MLNDLDVLITASELLTDIGRIDVASRIRKLYVEINQLNAEQSNGQSDSSPCTEVKETVFRDNAYWKGEEGPFCPHCWDDMNKLMRMTGNDGRFYCKCNYVWITKEAQAEEDRLFRELNNNYQHGQF